MAANKWSFEKTLVVYCFVFTLFTVLGTGVLMERTVSINKYGQDTYAFDSSLPVKYSSLSEASSSSKLKAIVKGSIYETGSNMTVFGACFDGDSYLLPQADAKFTAWYPNGSVVTGPNATMDRIYVDVDNPNGNSTNLPNGTGRWKIHVTMGSTIGTYLTEMRCEYQGEWAVAFGEWQNPEWVKRIGDTQGAVENISLLANSISNNLTIFQNSTQNNFNNVAAQLAGLSLNGSLQTNYLEKTINDLNLNRWVLDPKNPFFVLNSGVHNWAAVDMLSANSVAAVSFDGYFGLWDGDTWVEYNQTSIEFRGVSLLPSNTVYAWGAGTDGVNPVISVNGANVTIPASITGTALNDIKLFTPPNNPSQIYYSYALSNDGSFWQSLDAGTTWTQVATLGPAEYGRISQVVDNWDGYALTNGFLLLVTQNDTVATFDGVTPTYYTLPAGCVGRDTSLLQKDFGFVVAKCSNESRIYKFTGSNLTLDYVIQDPMIVPTGVAVLTPNNAWVTTLDPSVFYHFNGRRWEYSNIGWSQLVSVVVNFGNISTTGITDLTMSDTRHGYAVGSDGIILIFKSEESNDNVLAFLQSMNQSLSQDFATFNNTLLNMNTTVNYKLDNILNNVTYTQMYYETTIFPLANATYYNTVQILINLGIIQGQLNQTIQLQNDTLNIVNMTDQKVDQLLNRSNRIRAWTTQ